MALTIEFIRQSAAHGNYELSLHADDERLEEGLTVSEVEEALQSAELLEDYPEDPRGHGCLVLGYAGGQPIYLVLWTDKAGQIDCHHRLSSGYAQVER